MVCIIKPWFGIGIWVTAMSWYSEHMCCSCFQAPLPVASVSGSRSYSSRNNNNVLSVSVSVPSQQQHSHPLLRLYSVEGDYDADAVSRSASLSRDGNLKARLYALYKFTRPHTIRGTILASIAGTTRALLDSPTGALLNVNWNILLPRAIVGMIALLMGNCFIVGINQIYDVDIDMLNKPFLPVASGELSSRQAWVAVVASGVLGPLIVYNCFPLLLFRLYMTGLFLGGIYSVPPIRTKRNPILAGLTIAIVRGFLLNFGVYFAVRHAIGQTFVWNPKVQFVARFMTIFASVIAITKDLPDTEGDRANNIETFATKVGVQNIANTATILLFLNYITAIVTGLRNTHIFKSVPMLGGHATLAIVLLMRFRQLDANKMSSIKTYYKHIWDLFYLEYVLYTLI